MSIPRQLAAQPPALPPPPTDGSLRVLQVDFASVGLPDLSSRTCIVIDNLLTPEDGAKLYQAATLSSPWLQAKVSVGIGVEVLNTDYRNSDRIILDDHALAGWLFDKIEPHLSESVRRVKGAEHHEWIGSSYYEEAVRTCKEDKSGGLVKPVARLTRLNERLRFLRYGTGMYFQAHCDGQYWTPDTRECSYFTLQVYLAGEEGDEPPVGGATRIFSKETFDRGTSTLEAGARFIDVDPIPGRILIFEQEGIPHSGEKVTKGIKYSLRTDFMYEVVPAELETP